MSESSPSCCALRASTADYARLGEEERIEVLRRELASERLLASPYAEYTDETRAELAVVGLPPMRIGATATSAFNITSSPSRTACPTCSRSTSCSRRSDCIGHPPQRAALLRRAALRDDRRSSSARRPSCNAWLLLPGSRGGGARSRPPGSDGGLLGLEQRWWLSHLGVESASSHARARSGLQGARDAACSCFTDAVERLAAVAAHPSAAIRAQPAGTVQGRIRITEQGEVIAAKYGTRESAAANLQTMTAATVLASLDAAGFAERGAGSRSKRHSRKCHGTRFRHIANSSMRAPVSRTSSDR